MQISFRFLSMKINGSIIIRLVFSVLILYAHTVHADSNYRMSYNQFIKNSASDIFDRIDKYQNGGVTMIAHIKFKEGSYELEKSSESLLNEIGRKLMDVESEIYEKTGEQIHILLRAYTDNIGDYDDNLRLSRNRARRVANFLKNEFYFSLSKMEIEGCGENDPLFSNDTPQGREQNRRVEIILTKKKIIREVM